MSKNILISLFATVFCANLLAVEELKSKDEFDSKVLKSPGLVVVDFYWIKCGPCKQLAPEYEKISQEFPDVKFYKMESADSEKAGFIKSYAIRGYPTVLFFVDGEKVAAVTGYNPDAIRENINKHMTAEKPARSGRAAAGPVMR